QKWQWHLLTMLRQTVKTKEMNRLVDACYTRYRNGFVTNVQKGDVPSRYESLARYLAKYVVSPPISLRRIDGYDGQRVTYHYRSHKTERVERERVDVYTFIGRMMQHTFAKGFKRIRYYGVQATKVFHMCWPLSDGSSKCIPIDEEPNHQIVHAFRLGKAQRATNQPLDPGPEIDVLALDFLRVLLAYVMLLDIDMPLIGAPSVSVVLCDAKGL